MEKTEINNSFASMEKEENYNYVIKELQNYMLDNVFLNKVLDVEREERKKEKTETD
jgi:hypothetical protein